MDESDRRPTWLSNRLALGLVAVLTLGYAMSLGSILEGILGLVGALGLVRAAEAIISPAASRYDRSRASVGLVASALLVLVGVLLFEGVSRGLVGLALLATVFVGFGGSQAQFGGGDGSLFAVFNRSRDALLAVGIVLGLAQSGVLGILFVGASSVYPAVFQINLGLTIVFLEILVYLLVTTLRRAQRDIDARIDAPETDRFATISIGGNPVEESLTIVRDWFHQNTVFLLIQAVLLLFVGGFLGETLMNARPVGPALLAVFTWGVLHLLALAVIGVSLLVMSLAWLHEWATSTNVIDPPAVAASATGGFVLGLLTIPVVVFAPESVFAVVFGQRLSAVSTVIGPGAILLGSLALFLLGLKLLVVLMTILAAISGLASPRTSGGFVGSVLLLFAAVGAAEIGLTPIVVFASVAIAIFVWDFSEQASYLGVTVGDTGVSDDVEVLHATGAIGVAIVGIAIASSVGYLLGPIQTGSAQALVAIALSLLAALLFVILAR